MPKLVKRYQIACLALCIATQLPGLAAAEPVDERELKRWVPALSLQSGLNGQKVEAGLDASDILGPTLPDPNPNPSILPGTPLFDENRMMTPYVGTAVELMTPAWGMLPGRPRIYVHGDIGYGFGPEYNIVKVGDPGPFTVPSTVPPNVVTESAILGQGGETRAEVDSLVVAAGAGLAFTVDAWGRALRIKPSAEYLREEVHLEGIVRRAVSQSANGFGTLDSFRQITLTARGSRVYHGIGPGVELDLDTRRAGPFVLSLFLGFKAWAFIDNDKIVLTDQNEYGETATWEFKKNDWAYGGIVGLRFRWVPE